MYSLVVILLTANRNATHVMAARDALASGISNWRELGVLLFLEVSGLGRPRRL
jgi:hypothetical protein